jgi:Helix-turn-helix domain
MSPTYLTQVELAVRWRISPRTLERWRWAGEGPRFIKIGGLVRYRLEDIERFEAEQLRQITGTQQPELAPVMRIAPPMPSRRKKSTYAELRSFLLNGHGSVSP